MNAIGDVRYALRLLLRSPVFTITAVLSLAAGVSGTAAIFSLADAVLLRERPGVADPATLLDIGRTTDGGSIDNFGYPLFEEMRKGTTLLSGLAAHRISPEVMSLGDASSSERVYASLVSGNYFEVVGTRPALGRFFVAEEDRTADTHPVIVLSHEFWSRRFARSPDVLGTTVRLNSRPYTVVGVAEEGFTGTAFLGADFWVPMAMDAHVRASDRSLRGEHTAVWLVALGRMKPGAAIPQVRDELGGIMRGYLASRGDERLNRWGVAVARSERIPGSRATPVLGFVGMLGALTGLVLLIACSNVAGMLLARGLDRRRELATRLAVGASRGRLVGQLLVEGLVLALVAGALSVPLTYLLVGLLAGYQPELPVPLAFDLRVDSRVHAVVIGLAAMAAILFSLLPALQVTRVDVSPVLRGAGASPDRRRGWLRQLLVASQVAVALLLLVTAGLFLRSLQEAAHTDVGFTARGVDTLQIDTRIGGYPTDADGVRALESLIDRFRAVPGVTHVAASRMVPLQGGRLGLGMLRAPGYKGADGSDRVDADWDAISPEYFDALQIRLIAGRSFRPQDRAGAPHVAIVNQTMAARLWPGENAVGRTLIQEQPSGPPMTLEIVGVARDGKYRLVSDPTQSFIYVPLAQQFLSELTFYVRRPPDQSRINDLRRAVAAFNPMLPVIHTSTLGEATALGLLPQRLAAWIAAAVGMLGLFLAALGLYGLAAFNVSQRKREIAIRLAVGASGRRVIWLVMRQAAMLSIAGAVVGAALAALVSRLMSALLIGIGPIDPVAFGGALAVLAIVMLIASGNPARHAARTDVVRWLKTD